MRRLTPLIWFACSSFLGGCAVRHPPTTSPSPASVPVPAAQRAGPVTPSPGVLVMAHGGPGAWNASVEAAIAPLAEEIPTEIAFGMANPATLQHAVDQLESAGVTRIAVVRLFVSGESFLDRTEHLFKSGRVETSSQIEIDPEGLVDGFETGNILRSRAQELSHDFSSEAVLLIGHGSGDESVNEELLLSMNARTDVIRKDGFREVRVETLREDWAEPREEATHRIREWVADRSASGTRVIVIPFRLAGFGPYAEVLEGLDYEADGLGLLPHDAITAWLRRRVQTVLCANDWRHVAIACPNA